MHFSPNICIMGELKVKERVIILSISVVILSIMWFSKQTTCIDYTYHGHEVEVQQ